MMGKLQGKDSRVPPFQKIPDNMSIFLLHLVKVVDDLVVDLIEFHAVVRGGPLSGAAQSKKKLGDSA